MASVWYGCLHYGSAIHYACYHGNKVLIHKLLNYGAAINHIDNYCTITPLCFAAQSSEGLKVIDCIICHGGIPCNLTNKNPSKHQLWVNNNRFNLLEGIVNNPVGLIPGDCEKICRNIVLLDQFKKEDVSDVFKDVHHFISMVKHNKELDKPLPLLNVVERQLISYFEQNKLLLEVVVIIMEMAYESKADELVNKIPFLQSSTCGVDSLKDNLKKKIISDFNQEVKIVFQNVHNGKNSPVLALKS